MASAFVVRPIKSLTVRLEKRPFIGDLGGSALIELCTPGFVHLHQRIKKAITEHANVL